MLSLNTHHSTLITSLQISAGELSEFARPAVFTAAALASVWVLRDARRREGFGGAAVWAWALLTLAFPPAVLPLYLAARLYTARAAPVESGPPAGAVEGGKAVGETSTAPAEGSGGGQDGVSADETDAAVAPSRARWSATAFYAAALALAGGLYFYTDYVSLDARLARAERAKLYGRTGAAVAEYRAALRLREDAHTRKLLGLELLRAGRALEALNELRAAGRDAPPAEQDDSLHFHAAEALDALGRRREAVDEYRRFLESRSCAPHPLEERCEAARTRLRDGAGAAPE